MYKRVHAKNPLAAVHDAAKRGGACPTQLRASLALVLCVGALFICSVARTPDLTSNPRSIRSASLVKMATTHQRRAQSIHINNSTAVAELFTTKNQHLLDNARLGIHAAKRVHGTVRLPEISGSFAYRYSPVPADAPHPTRLCPTATP